MRRARIFQQKDVGIRSRKKHVGLTPLSLQKFAEPPVLMQKTEKHKKWPCSKPYGSHTLSKTAACVRRFDLANADKMPNMCSHMVQSVFSKPYNSIMPRHVSLRKVSFQNFAPQGQKLYTALSLAVDTFLSPHFHQCCRVLIKGGVGGVVQTPNALLKPPDVHLTALLCRLVQLLDHVEESAPTLFASI